MTLYSLILFVHVTAVLLLSVALGFESLSLFNLRRVTTLAEARPWIDPVPRLPLVAVGSLLVILFTGIYMVIPAVSSGEAWPKVAVTTLLLMAPLGAITARRMHALRESYRLAKAINSDLLVRLRDPFLKISLCIRIVVFFGIFLLVSAKPGLWASIELVGAAAVLGLLSSLVVSRRGQSVSVPTADLGD